jgi:hypothetical protein
VWTFPNNNSCTAECPYNKYTPKMLCYVSGCGGMLVQLNGYCLDACPSGYYVNQNQDCIACAGSSMCSRLFRAQMEILRSFNLRACLYFNQLVNYQNVNLSLIKTVFYSQTDESIWIDYLPNYISINENMIMI